MWNFVKSFDEPTSVMIHWWTWELCRITWVWKLSKKWEDRHPILAVDHFPMSVFLDSNNLVKFFWKQTVPRTQPTGVVLFTWRTGVVEQEEARMNHFYCNCTEPYPSIVTSKSNLYLISKPLSSGYKKLLTWNSCKSGYFIRNS